jgi:hypothetical protein
MVKVACGLYSVAAKDGVKLSNTHRINLEEARRALFQRDWDARAGLYFVASPGNKVALQDSVAMAPITADNDSIFVGANVSLLGFTMGALFDDSKTIPLPWPGIERRPSEFVLIKNRRQLRFS